MDYVIEQQLSNIEDLSRKQQQIAQNQNQLSQQILRSVQGIFGYCEGMEIVAKHFSPIIISETSHIVNEVDQLNITTVSENRLLKFTEKEIIQMPKTLKKEFRAQGCIAHIRKRTDGRYKCSYEIRYNRNGYHISASATTLEEAKKRFIEKLILAEDERKNPQSKIPTNFHAFSTYWFENFHKRKVKENTYEESIKLYNRHIRAKFGNFALKDITPLNLQHFLDSFAKKGRTADYLYSQLNQIFKAAVNHGIIQLNPLSMCFHKHHEHKHGKAISKANENRLLEAFNGTPYQMYFAIILYTGLRPNEYATVTIDDEFIKAVNSKRHNQNDGVIEYKRIPISPMLRPYLQGIKQIKFPTPRMLENRFKKILPEHKLYDMRTTFQTRCSECGMPDNVIGIFMGNSIGRLKETYTDFSDEYLLKEGEKLLY